MFGPVVGQSSLRSQRLPQIDALRGLAAVLVYISHIATAISVDAARITIGYVQIGHLGVGIFFLCSGYCIPSSLERLDSLPRFWVRRAFRLLPLYWLTLGLALVWYDLGWFTEWNNNDSEQVANLLREDFLRVIIWHVPMWQWWAGIPSLMYLYWTLVVEEAFYLLVAMLFVTRWLRYTVIVALACFGLTIFGDPYLGMPWGAYLTMLWAGRIIFCVRFGTLAHRPAFYLLAATLVIVTIPLTPVAWSGSLLNLPDRTARALALVVFGSVLLLPAARIPRWATHLGVISYSFYLLHPLLMAALPQWPPLERTLAVWTLVLLIVRR